MVGADEGFEATALFEGFAAAGFLADGFFLTGRFLAAGFLTVFFLSSFLVVFFFFTGFLAFFFRVFFMATPFDENQEACAYCNQQKLKKQWVLLIARCFGLAVREFDEVPIGIPYDAVVAQNRSSIPGRFHQTIFGIGHIGNKVYFVAVRDMEPEVIHQAFGCLWNFRSLDQYNNQAVSVMPMPDPGNAGSLLMPIVDNLHFSVSPIELYCFRNILGSQRKMIQPGCGRHFRSSEKIL
jgi:hypothetical protein